MADRKKVLPRPLFQRNEDWDSFQDRAQTNDSFDWCVGLPSLLERCDISWINTAKGRLAALSSLGHVQSSLLKTASKGLQTEPGLWKICLSISPFSQREITMNVTEGYLKITGKQGERQNEHGVVSQSFIRKYKLPSDVGLQHISSSVSEDGILTVEAHLPPSTPAHTPESVEPVEMKQEQ